MNTMNASGSSVNAWSVLVVDVVLVDELAVGLVIERPDLRGRDQRQALRGAIVDLESPVVRDTRLRPCERCRPWWDR